MYQCKPLELVGLTRHYLGEPEFSMYQDEDFCNYSEADIIHRLSDVLMDLWERFLPSHASNWKTEKTITMISGTYTYAFTAAEACLLHSILGVVDGNDQEIRSINYRDRELYEKRGDNAYWLVQSAQDALSIGFVFPNSVDTITVRYVSRPRLMIGGRGGSTSDGGTPAKAQVRVPYWANIADSYYSTSNLVEHCTISDHEPDATTRVQSTVSSMSSQVLKWGDVTNVGSNGFWCVCPEWCPPAAKEYVCIAAAKSLKIREGAPPNWMREELQEAEFKFRQRYTADNVKGVAHYYLQDQME